MELGSEILECVANNPSLFKVFTIIMRTFPPSLNPLVKFILENKFWDWLLTPNFSASLTSSTLSKCPPLRVLIKAVNKLKSEGENSGL